MLDSLYRASVSVRKSKMTQMMTYHLLSYITWYVRDRPIKFALILVIMSISTFITAVIFCLSIFLFLFKQSPNLSTSDGNLYFFQLQFFLAQVTKHFYLLSAVWRIFKLQSKNSGNFSLCTSARVRNLDAT